MEFTLEFAGKEKLKPLNTAAVWKEGATNTAETGSTKAKNTLLSKKRALQCALPSLRCHRDAHCALTAGTHRICASAASASRR